MLAVVLASLGFAIYERQSYRASAVRELTALADTLGANSAASLAFNDQATAKAMLGAPWLPNLISWPPASTTTRDASLPEYRSPGAHAQS